jgi:hypothetical protein
MREVLEVEVPRVLARVVDVLLATKRLRDVEAVSGGRVLQQRGWPEEQSVDNAEHGGVRADPEANGGDDRRSETPASGEVRARRT